MKFLKANLGLSLFLLFALIGLFTNQYYGISWDEFFMRDMGRVTFEYIFLDNPEFLSFDGRDYGMAFELPLYMIERALNVTDIHDIYYLRHFLTHLLFLYGAYCCYALINFMYNNAYLASLGFLLVVLNPIIYGHSFFNTKDVPMLAVFFICFYWFAKSFKLGKTKYFLILGIFLGILVNIRIAGFIIAATAIEFIVFDFFVALKTEHKIDKKILVNILVLIGAFCCVTFLFWPLIWHNTMDNISFVFKRMSTFRWDGNTLLNGNLYHSLNMPWFYFFNCFGITNPLVYVILGIISFVLIVIGFLKSPKLYILNHTERNLTLYVLCFFGPVFLVVFLHSVIFDNWRHLYFVYAPFVLITIKGIQVLSESKYKWITHTAIAVSFAFVIIYSLNNFPNQHIYFNKLVSHEPEYLRKNFERDYWGTSFKQGLEYILNTDPRDSIRVAVNSTSGSNNRKVLNHKLKGKFIEVWKGYADYFITEYRYHPEDYEEYAGKKVYSVKVQNSEIIAVFKLK